GELVTVGDREVEAALPDRAADHRLDELPGDQGLGRGVEGVVDDHVEHRTARGTAQALHRSVEPKGAEVDVRTGVGGVPAAQAFQQLRGDKVDAVGKIDDEHLDHALEEG